MSMGSNSFPSFSQVTVGFRSLWAKQGRGERAENTTIRTVLVARPRIFSALHMYTPISIKVASVNHVS